MGPRPSSAYTGPSFGKKCSTTGRLRRPQWQETVNAGLRVYLIGEISREDGCRDTVTFDRALRGAPGFAVVG